ncbi:MAG: alpha/beta fold hydrolase [Candidatus Sericytochromatia bacterium]
MPKRSALKPCASRLKLFFLHGFAGSNRDWDFYLQALSEKDDCLAPDLPGHGANGSPIGSFSETVSQLKSLCLAEPKGNWVLIGYSLGARLALALALEPELRPHLQGLVLISGSPGLKTQAERFSRQNWENQWAEAFQKAPLAETFAQWYAQDLFGRLQDRPMFKHLQARREANSGQKLAESLLRLGSGSQPLLWGHLPELQLPCLCLCGEEDSRYVALNAEMVALMPQAEVKILTGVAHALHLEDPPSTLKALLPFLEKRRALLK